MFKKVIAVTIVLVLVSASGSVSYSHIVTDEENPISLENIDEINVSLKRQLEIYKPESGRISDRIVLLSGVAPQGSKVIVEVYSTPSIFNTYNFSLYDTDFWNPAQLETEENEMNTKEYELDTEGYELSTEENEMNTKENQIKEDIYLPPVVSEIEVGALGYFAKELELKIGFNKIKIYIEGSDDLKIIYIYVNDPSKAEKFIEGIDNMGILNNIEKVFEQEEIESFLKSDKIPKTECTKDNLDNEDVIDVIDDIQENSLQNDTNQNEEEN